jgi:hypothetical protein
MSVAKPAYRSSLWFVHVFRNTEHAYLAKRLKAFFFYRSTEYSSWAVPWLRRLVSGLSPRRTGFDPRSVHVGFVMDEVALGQVFTRVPRVFPVNFVPPLFHYTEKRKKLIIFITGLHNKPQGCGASVASAAGSSKKKAHSCFKTNIKYMSSCPKQLTASIQYYWGFSIHINKF